MSIFKNGKKAILYKGNHKTAAIYKGINELEGYSLIPTANNKILSEYNEAIKAYGNGYHNKVRNGSHYTFYGSSDVVESENLCPIATFTSTKVNQFSSIYGIPTEIGKTYTLSFDCSNISSLDQRFSMELHNVPQLETDTTNAHYITGAITSLKIGKNTLSITPTVASYIYIKSVGNGTIINNIFISNNGNTTYTPYFAPFIQNKGEKNEFVRANAIEKTTINTTTGKTESNDTYVTSEFIKVSSGITYCRSSGNIMHFYNTNKEWISSEAVGNPFTIPSGVSYMRVVVSYVNLPNFVMVKGNVAPSYYIPSDNNYYLPFNNTLINLGPEPLRLGETRSTDGRRTIAKKTTVVDGVNVKADYYGIFGGHNIFFVEIGKEVSGLFSHLSPISNLYDSYEGAANIMPNKSIRYQGDPSNQNTNRIYWNDDDFTSADMMNEYLSKNNLIIESHLLNTTEILDTYDFESGLLGADEETPRYTLNYGYVERIDIQKEDGTIVDTKTLNLPLLENGTITDDTAENEYGVINAWELNLNYMASSKIFYLFKNDTENLASNNLLGDLKCNIYDNYSFDNLVNHQPKGIALGITNVLAFRDDDFNGDINLFKAHLQANNVKIIYKLANKRIDKLDLPSTLPNITCTVSSKSNTALTFKYFKHK